MSNFQKDFVLKLCVKCFYKQTASDPWDPIVDIARYSLQDPKYYRVIEHLFSTNSYIFKAWRNFVLKITLWVPNHFKSPNQNMELALNLMIMTATIIILPYLNKSKILKSYLNLIAFRKILIVLFPGQVRFTWDLCYLCLVYML